MIPQISVKDRYIGTFFLIYYPQLPIEIKIRILSFASIEEILLIQSCIKDHDTKQLPLGLITKEKLSYEIECEYSGEIMWFLGFLNKYVSLMKDKLYSIPLQLKFTDANMFKTSLYLSTTKSYRGINFELNFDQLSYKQCLSLISNYCELNIQALRIEKIIGLKLDSQLNFSDFRALKTFNLVTNYSLLKLTLSSFQTITDLTIDNAFDGQYYSNFVNLKAFHIHVSKGRNFEIQHVPRCVTSLMVSVKSARKFFDTTRKLGHVKIESRQDWPPQLESLSLDDSQNKSRAFTDLLGKLPLNLPVLSICGHSQRHILTQVSESIRELSLQSTFKILNEELVDLTFEFHKNLEALSFTNLQIVSLTKSCKLPKRLKIFKIYDCDFSLSLNYFKFDNCKSTLKCLRVGRYKEPIEFINLNFSEFSNLTNIYFESCGIKNLSHFRPPYCLKILEIYHNPISAIDESCDLFNNENDYPLLQEIYIEDCQISFISQKVEWPINLKHLTIKDEIVKDFYFNSSIAKHQSLRILRLSKLSAIKFCDCIKVSSKSNFTQLDLTVTQDFLPTNPYELLKFYDEVNLFLRKKSY